MAKKKSNPRPPNDRDQGRDSEFKEEFCQQLVWHMEKGYSFETFAAKADVSRQTLYNWVDQYPQWAKAKDIAFNKCLLFWEQQGIDGLYNESFKDGDGSTHSKSINASLWIFNMKNRFKWRDRLDEEEKKSDRPLKELSDDELNAKLGVNDK